MSSSLKNQRYVGRAVQLDITELDNYFVNNVIFHLNSISDSTYGYVPELKLLIQLLLWYRKLFTHNSSIGLDIYQCRYYSTKNQSTSSIGFSLIQKCSYLLKYSLQYVQERLDQYPTNQKWTKIVEKFLLYYRAIEMLNLYVFIYNGKYRTLHERLFGIRIVGERTSSLDDSKLNHSFLNRVLMWNAMIEVLTILIPFITSTSLYRLIIKRIHSIKSDQQQNSNNVKKPMKNNRCQICDQPAVNAQAIPNCRHIYCYFCIIHNLFEDGIFKCNHCQVSIDSSDKLLQTFNN